jgi:methylase of polypeptide subunit release factors
MLPPLRVGPDSAFKIVREFLGRSDYTDRSAAARLGFERLDLIGRYDLCDHQARERHFRSADALNTLIKIFILGQAIPAAEVCGTVPSDVLGAMVDLNLLEQHSDAFQSPVLLYPIVGLWVASDRFKNPDQSEPAHVDFVYLALHRSASDFLATIPNAPCSTFLDLGCGAGVATLLAARDFAKHAWAVDIGARSVHFTEFNRRLNGIENVTVLQGDMYLPIAGRQFDRIVMHPPYAIGKKSPFIYADGGDDGEQLTRRALEEGRPYLAPGGILYIWTMASDRTNAPLEQRVRGMLGPDSQEFDVAILSDDQSDPENYAMATLISGPDPARELTSWRGRFVQLGIEQLVYGGILVRRRTVNGQLPFTVRRKRSSETDHAAIEWMLRWENAAAQSGRDAILMETKPTASDRAVLTVRHRMRDGSLQPIEYAFSTNYPFESVLRCRSWLAYLFSRCNGNRTGAELYKELASHLPAENARETFLSALAALISGGFVEII